MLVDHKRVVVATFAFFFAVACLHLNSATSWHFSPHAHQVIIVYVLRQSSLARHVSIPSTTLQLIVVLGHKLGQRTQSVVLRVALVSSVFN